VRKPLRRSLASITAASFLFSPASGWAQSSGPQGLQVPLITAPTATVVVISPHANKPSSSGPAGLPSGGPGGSPASNPISGPNNNGPQTGTPDPGNGIFSNPTPAMCLTSASPALSASPTFNSGSKVPSPWGLGWSSESDQTMALKYTGVVTWTDGTGGQTNFFVTSSSAAGVPTYNVPLNTFTTLTAQAASGGVPTSLLERDKDGTTRQFTVFDSTSVLRLSLLTDRNGNTISYSRDGQGRLTHLVDVHGRYFNVGYSTSGYVSSLADSGGRTTAYGYDGAGHLTSVNGPIGLTSYQYDASNRMTKIVYPNGGVKNYAYDAKNRVVSEDDGNGNDLLTYAYGASSTTVTDALGHATVYQFTHQGGLNKVTRVTDAASGVTNFVYDSNLNLITVSDPLARVTHYGYDANGNVTAAQNANSGTSHATYDATFNQAASITDPLNRITSFSYDAHGNLTQIVDPMNGAITNTYDGVGHVTQTVDPLNHATNFTYTPSNGALANVTDPLSHITQMTTDALSQITRNTDPSGKQTQLAYDSAGNLTEATDAMNNVTRYSYNPGRDSKFLATVTDANGHATTFDYDDLGRMTSVTNALNQARSIQYNAKGNPTQTTNARGQTITYAYDSLDRLSTKTLPEGIIRYTHDAAGNTTKLTHYNGSSLQNTYDTLNRLTQVIQTLPNGYAATIAYIYDAVGNRTAMTTPWGSFGYTYDANNRLTSITNPQGKAFTFTYDVAGRRIGLNYPNGIVTNYIYDNASQVLSIIATRASDSIVISSQAYTYDAAGNRTSMTDTEGTHNYSYDDLHRLTQAIHPTGTVLPVQTETFSYDGVGNRLADAQIGGYTYDNANRMALNSSFTYNYDADGNLSGKTDRSSSAVTGFTYDSQNQLVGVTLPDGENWIYKYDAKGRRVEKSSGSASGQAQGYVFDGQNVLAVLDGANSPQEVFTNGLNIDEPLFMKQASNGEYSFHQDALGSVRVLTDSGAAISESYSYLSYGKPMIAGATGAPANTSALGNHLLFAGREFDTESGFVNERKRYLDPVIGGFVSEDPLGIVAGANLYQYVGSRPTAKVDPYGLYPTGAQADDQYYIDEGADPTYLEADIVFFFMLGAPEAAGEATDLACHAATGKPLRAFIRLERGTFSNLSSSGMKGPLRDVLHINIGDLHIFLNPIDYQKITGSYLKFWWRTPK
jgi:RHS repeat-associated protein